MEKKLTEAEIEDMITKSELYSDILHIDWDSQDGKLFKRFVNLVYERGVTDGVEIMGKFLVKAYVKN